MARDLKILVDAKMVLNAVISGADVDKVKRHWPQYAISIEEGKCISIACTDDELARIKAQQEALVAEEQTKADQRAAEEKLAREAAEAAEKEAEEEHKRLFPKAHGDAPEAVPPAAPDASTLIPVT